MTDHYPRIVTLAQLWLLPLGTVASPLSLRWKDYKPYALFDCQGTLLLGPQFRVVRKSEAFLDAMGLMPDIKVVDGKAVAHPDSHSYGRGGLQRFVVWSTSDWTAPRTRK